MPPAAFPHAPSGYLATVYRVGRRNAVLGATCVAAGLTAYFLFRTPPGRTIGVGEFLGLLVATAGIVVCVIALPAAINPRLAGTVRALAAHGPLEAVLAEVERELSGRVEEFGPLRVTPRWLIVSDYLRVFAVPLAEIRGARHITRTMERSKRVVGHSIELQIAKRGVVRFEVHENEVGVAIAAIRERAALQG